MAEIAPFMGLTYNRKKFEDPARLMAPPYDVISEEEQDLYYRMDPHNVIRLILGKKKVGDSDWDNRYTRSAETFKRWQSQNILVRDRQPSMYVTSMAFDPGDGGGERVRWGLIVLVHIEEEGSGVILPHERTFSAHRNDRLNLMRACGAQFSQIFALYEDTDNLVLGAMEESLRRPPHLSFELADKTWHRMWIIQDYAGFKKVNDLMASKSILIADGHHRYETARNYRNILRIRYGRRPPNRSYEYVMMYLSNMDDPGLAILASHRLIKRRAGFEVGAFLERIKEWFDVHPLPGSVGNTSASWLQLKEALDQRGKESSVIGFRHYGIAQSYLFILKPEMREPMGDDLDPSLKRLDVLVLSRFILQKALCFSKEDLDDEEIFHYDSNMARTLSLVEEGNFQMAFLLNPTRMEQVKEVAGKGLIMPRKSTYFYPKTLSGLVFNKIDPHELISLP